MEHDFWNQRWRENRIGFHQDRPSPMAVAHWDALALPRDARVFVPLCGKTLDMVWLAERGHSVLGVELSELAVRQFFDERGLSPRTWRTDAGLHFAAGPYEIVCGDAFALPATLLSECTGVLDRAAVIALPPELRRRYADTTYARLPAGCRALMITLEYPHDEKQGPPFPVDEADMRALFGRDWRPELLERRDILAREPGFQAEGITRLHTCAWRLGHAPQRA